MKNVSIFFVIICLLAVPYSIYAAEPAAPAKSKQLPPTKPEAKKEPRSLLGVDPYDVEGKEVLDPYDVEDSNYIDPNDAGNGKKSGAPVTPPATTQPVPLKPPKIVEDLKAPLQALQDKAAEPKPDVTLTDLKYEVGAGYAGAFSGSLLGLFGGFMVGSLYGELASCSRCWIDFASGGSVIGASLLTSAGVYMFGNNEKQLGSFYATVAGSLVPVALAEGLYSESKQIRKSGFYLLTMPLFATIGYNISRHFRKPEEKPLFENIFIDDAWVSADPVGGVVAFNISAHF